MKKLYSLIIVIIILGLMAALISPRIMEHPAESKAMKALIERENQIIAGKLEQLQNDNFNTEEYDRIYENVFKDVIQNPLSTFSIDVDTASYSNVRRFIIQSQLPPKDAVRIEEFINYFNYEYPSPKNEHPFSITTEISTCPWNTQHQLLHIGLQGKKIPPEKFPANNLVFLIDVSGSMDSAVKLPLLKSAFKLLTDQLRKEDKISIVVYAGAAGLVLPSTPGDKKTTILKALERLQAGGSTAGGDGIELAYRVAENNFIKGGNNRIVLATDGDFNIGITSDSELIRLIEKKRDKNIFLTILGFGSGNYKDSKMEKLADKGNGNYAYIDNVLEAKKVLVRELAGTLITIAKDVKIQIEFNPVKIKAYRLIGYENRILSKEEFDDDTKDAGELGAGHSVTALYELITSNSEEKITVSGKLKYQETVISPESNRTNELMTVKFRYKQPDNDNSILITHIVPDKSLSFEVTSDNFKFSSAVAEFGLLLRDSEFKGEATFDQVLNLAKLSKAKDENGYRAEFIKLVETSALLTK